MLRNCFFSAALLVSLFAHFAWSFEPPPLTGPVVDQAQVIEPSDQRYLESQIRSLYESQKIQIQILTLKTLNDEPIEQVSIDTVDKWKLGDKSTDKGILILVAPQDKKVRIEVGQGLEGEVPDILANQIIQQKLLPSFRHGEFGKGMIAAVGTIEALLSPETAKAARKSFSDSRSRSGGRAGVIKLLLFIFAFFILSFLGGGRGGGRGFLLGMLLGGLVGGGRGSRGFGGGGGWSGGGGGFSGGGASGGW